MASPVIVSVDVDVAGNIIICWDPVIDVDLIGYNVWTIDGSTGANVLLSGPGLLAPTINCFLIPSTAASPGAQTVQVLVEAVIDCPPNGTIFSPGLLSGVGFVNTVYLQTDFDKCTSSVDLNWNAFNAYSNPIVRYEVFVSINGAPLALAGSTFSTNFSYPGVINGNTYAFRVAAIENAGLGPIESTSNMDTADVLTALISPTFNELNFVTVVDAQQVDIQFSIDTVADVTAYNIQRSDGDTNDFVTIETVVKFQGMDTLIDFSDDKVNTDTIPYFYRIEIINSECGFNGNYSNVASTMLIDVTSNSLEAFNTITITEYKEWGLAILRYELYRALGGVWDPDPIATLRPFSNATTIVDDVSGVSDGDGEFCYKVLAVRKNDSLEAFQSYSNESCALHTPLVYIPNAFAPDGLFNREFKPMLTFVNPSTYLLRIFNRWGEIVFETRDVDQAWNGRFDNSGEMSTTGVYFYVLKFNSADGLQSTKRGSITLVD